MAMRSVILMKHDSKFKGKMNGHSWKKIPFTPLWPLAVDPRLSGEGVGGPAVRPEAFEFGELTDDRGPRSTADHLNTPKEPILQNHQTVGKNAVRSGGGNNKS